MYCTCPEYRIALCSVCVKSVTCIVVCTARVHSVTWMALCISDSQITAIHLDCAVYFGFPDYRYSFLDCAVYFRFPVVAIHLDYAVYFRCPECRCSFGLCCVFQMPRLSLFTWIMLYVADDQIVAVQLDSAVYCRCAACHCSLIYIVYCRCPDCLHATSAQSRHCNARRCTLSNRGTGCLLPVSPSQWRR